MQSALAIVPPDDAWDRLQRARHIARDASLTKWPPAIRLFHPCASADDLALSVAEVIDQYQTEPFTVTLSQWSIIPHAEAMEADLLALQQPDQAVLETPASEDDRRRQQTEELIQQVETAGRINKIKREAALQRRRRKKQQHSATEQPPPSEPKKHDRELPSDDNSPQLLLEKQKRMYEEFNGPCVVCLEPDEESKARLQELRAILKHELFSDDHLDLYSPTSSVTPSSSRRLPVTLIDDPTDYRPLVPIAAFPTVTSAIEMARQLRSRWEPLAFDVTDLHFMSCPSTAPAVPKAVPSELALLREQGTDAEAWLAQQQAQRPIMGDLWSGEEEQLAAGVGQFGCDALVMLVGQEEQADQELVSEMAQLVCEHGEKGGADREAVAAAALENVHDDEEVDEMDDGDVSGLEQWLDEEDEDYDEGTVVVIGRTHFFTGEMRNYVGMPATSIIDAKDRGVGGLMGGLPRKGSLLEDR